ncbi:TetR/AcrR family transcriptional regulator [Streptomyces flavofungini]|uniref:TetR/AcrR family transcriptional regulator n=1 Tax=Streptomyces flavofungini TaxID=68200 RepID=UPI0025B11660|nr:TetR/AcrR family transcriptional regulator C-terminal domain-containing protein [Streptomyces flavofungini]WJV48619.1 TetR/AcrR family transcriptional regulator C-terminal domain-containing protein [Streptomyces flavofungini]
MPRETLTRDQIVKAAIELLDAEGVDGLSMRRLGRHLGSAATAMYWHVGSKDKLIALAGDHVWGEVGLPDPDAIGWRAAATAFAHEWYAMLTRHQWLMPASGSHVIYGPETARRQDHCYRIFEAAGLTGEELDGAVTTLLTFVTGTALEDAAAATMRARIRREGGDVEQGVKEVVEWANGVAMEFPRLRARIEAGARARVTETPDAPEPDTAPEDAAPRAAPSTAKIAFGVETILDGLQARLDARTGSTPQP